MAGATTPCGPRGLKSKSVSKCDCTKDRHINRSSTLKDLIGYLCDRFLETHPSGKCSHDPKDLKNRCLYTHHMKYEQRYWIKMNGQTIKTFAGLEEIVAYYRSL